MNKKSKIRDNNTSYKKKILSKILYTIIYDIIVLSIMISYANIIISNVILKPILVLSMYMGLISIGVVGAYLFTKIETKIQEYYQKHKLDSISKKTKSKNEKNTFEKIKQDQAKKETTEIKNNLENITSKIPQKNYTNNIYKNNSSNHKVRRKKKIKY